MTYGTSIKLNIYSDFEINSLTKQTELVTDLDNLSQALTILLSTYVGENKFYPLYGTKISSIIGGNTPSHYIEYILTKSLLNDPRVKSIVSTDIIRNGENVSVNIKFMSNEDAIVDLRGIIIW